MTTLQTTVNFLPSWTSAVEADKAAATLEGDYTPVRTCDEDGTFHFSHLKHIAESGVQYLHAVNNPIEPNAAMLLGTAVHLLVLGPRPGAKPLVVFHGKTRSGKAWDEFEAANAGAEILTVKEWSKAETIAEAVKADPVAQQMLAGARFEVPLTWTEGELRCSTSGIDIVTADGALRDLKTTSTTSLRAWQSHAWKMHYPMQMAWYRRGALANGIDCSRGLGLLGVETGGAHEVVDLDLSVDAIDMADRTLSMWLEKLRAYLSAVPRPATVKSWPGRAQSSVTLTAPSWMQDDDEEDAA